MSKYFITDAPVPIAEFDAEQVYSDVAPNVIWIKARMDVQTDGRVKSELVKMAADGKTAEFALGAQQTALLVHNIVHWEGPDLSGVACTPENIRRLDPTEPHIALVLEAIAERNRPRSAPVPNSPTASGSPASGSPAESPISVRETWDRSANGASTSPLRSALAGRLTK